MLDTSKNIEKSVILLLIGGSIVGIGPILAKSIDAPAIALVLYRMLLPVPILYILNKYRNKHKVATKINKTETLTMIGIGLFFSLDLVTFYYSLQQISVASATLISNFSPIFIGLYAIIFNKKFSKEIIWLLISIIGLALLCDITNESLSSDLYGDCLALTAAVFFTGYILLINKLGSKFNSLEIMLKSSIGGGIFLLILCYSLNIDIRITSINDLIMLITMCWGAQLIGQTILTSAIAKLPPSLSSIGILIDPIAATILAWLILGETLTMSKIIGSTLILAGIYFSCITLSKPIMTDERTNA